METRILDIENIQKSFAINFGGKGRGFATEYKNVINGLSLSLERGKVTALVGGNGAGKTTLFNLVSGLLRPDAGQIVFYGKSENIICNNSNPWQISYAGIGRLFQGTKVFGELSVMDNLILQSKPGKSELPFYNIFKERKTKQAIRDTKDRIDEVLSKNDEFKSILKLSYKPASSLSYAQQRMLSLAGLLIGDYDLLLIDEPSSGLSPESYPSLFAFMDDVKKQGKSIFLIEHNMEFVSKAADISYYMSEGEIKYSGTPDEVLNKEEVRQSYLL